MTKEVHRKTTSGKGWTAIPNTVIRNPDLTCNAVRVLLILHSFSDDFQFNAAYVQKCSGLGRDSYRAAVAQLQDAGLLRVNQTRVGGKFVWDYTTFPDSPCPEMPATVQPATVGPGTVEPATVNQAILRRPLQKTTLEEHSEKSSVEPDVTRVVVEDLIVGKPSGALPYDQWVSDEFSRFGYHLPIPVSQNIAARTLTAMSREYGEQYITDRLSELTGRPQAAVVKYILQDGAGWLQRKLNPPPAREQRARANRREIYRDPQFVGKPFPVATTDADLDEMFGPDPSKKVKNEL